MYCCRVYIKVFEDNPKEEKIKTEQNYTPEWEIKEQIKIVMSKSYLDT